MEKEYIKELDHTYLILAKDPINEDEYVMQMVMRGKLTGILPLRIAAKDGRKTLRADVTACTSIFARYKNVELTGSDMRKILAAIRDTALKMPGLLMSVRDLYLDPECIFFGPGGDEVLVCYVPHLSDSEPDSVRLLSEFLLKKLDHSDTLATQLAYTLYDQVSSDSCVLTDVLSNLLPAAGKAEGREEPASSVSASGKGTDSHPYAGENQYAPDASVWPSDVSAPAYSENVRRAQPGNAPHPAMSGYEAFSGMNVKKLPPPVKGRSSGNSKGRHDRSRPPKTGKASGKAAAARRPARRASLSRFLPALIIIPAACVAIIVFQMDLTQIMGMGFLCASLIWIIHSSLEKHRDEGRNLWLDDEEDMESDDQFYQSLRKELYAEDMTAHPPSMNAQQNNGSFFESRLEQGASFSGSRLEQGASFSGSRLEQGAEPEDRTRMLHSEKPVLVSLQKDVCPDIVISRDYLILGKSRTQSDVVLSGDTISRKHARIERRMDGYYVTDLFSTNGTFLDGHRLESGQAVALTDGAQLTFASLHYRAAIPDL